MVLFFHQVKVEFSNGTPNPYFKVVVQHAMIQSQELTTDINGLAHFTFNMSLAISTSIHVSVSLSFVCVCMLVLCDLADVFHSKQSIIDEFKHNTPEINASYVAAAMISIYQCKFLSIQGCLHLFY